MISGGLRTMLEKRCDTGKQMGQRLGIKSKM